MQDITIKPDKTDPRMLLVDGVKTAQSPNVIEFLDSLPNVRIVVEIGTSYGGFSILLKRRFQTAVVHTWDITKKFNKRKLSRYRITTHIEDVFESQYLVDVMSCSIPKIIFCDGGIKKDEFVRAQWAANVGDIICVHDFFYSPDDRDDKLWPTCEAWHDMLPKFGTEYIGTKVSESAVWGMYRVVKDVTQ